MKKVIEIKPELENSTLDKIFLSDKSEEIFRGWQNFFPTKILSDIFLSNKVFYCFWMFVVNKLFTYTTCAYLKQIKGVSMRIL